MVTAIWYVLRTGCPWRDVPVQFGPWSSVYTRWRRWCASGLWGKILALLVRGAAGQLRHLDCSHIKLHQHGANPAGGQTQQAIGRTKGGINTKLAAVVDARGRAVALCLAPGQRHDLKAVLPLVPAMRGKPAVGDAGSTPTTFARCFGFSVCVSASRCVAAGVTFRRSTAVTTGPVIRSKTSSVGSKNFAASPPAMTSWLAPISALSSSLPSWIGSLVRFENTA